MVNIFEALFILALDDEEGDIVESVVSDLESSLAGAILAELVLQKHVTLVDHRVAITDPSAMEHPVLDKALFDIVDAAKPRKLRYWINTLNYKKLQDDIAHYLVERGILVRKKKRLYLVSPYNEGSEKNISAKFSLKNRLREIILAGQPPEESEKVLLAFLYYLGLLKLVFTQGERKAAHKRVKKLVETEEEGSPLGEILDAVVAGTGAFDH
jgi:golgi phosphoprotein 3